MTLREYAKSRGVSYEAVRNQVKRYSDDLNGHISRVNRSQWLDDYAVRFLDEHRRGQPIVVVESPGGSDGGEQVRALMAQLLTAQQQIINLQSELMECKTQIALLESAESKRENETTLSKAMLEEREREISLLRSELESIKEEKTNKKTFLQKLFF